MKKKMTIDALAKATQDGFKAVRKDIGSLAKTTENEFQAVRQEIDQLAEITQNEFHAVRQEMDGNFSGVRATLKRLEAGQERVLEVVMDLPTRREFNGLEGKVEAMDVRLTSVERKVK